jgi:hypothetical protein
MAIGRVKTIFAAGALLALLALVARPARAGGVGADTLALFPKETGELGYAELKAARSMKWFPALEQQVLPDRFRQFEKFLASAGIDPSTQVDELVWGLVPNSTTKDSNGNPTSVPSGEHIVGIAMGNYNPESTEAYFKQQKLATSKVGDYTLYGFTGGSGDDLYFFFLDSNKAVFGHRVLLEKLLAIRAGTEEGLVQNQTMYNLVSEANNSGVVWAVLDGGYTQLAMSQLAPEVQQFPDAAKLVQNMKSMVISANASNGVDAKFQAVCGSTNDANTLSQLLTMGLMYKKYQAKDNPDFGQLLDQTNVTPSGDRIVIGMTVSDDQMTDLIKHNTFALKM